MTLEIDIAVEAEAWSAVAALPALVRRAVEMAAEVAGTDLPAAAELSVLFCDDDAIRVLNRDWRGLDKATNVLSFPAGGEAGPGPRLLGDIAVAFETTRREAAEEGKPLDAHLTHLLVHGFLHLLGHDHEAEAEAHTMEALETRILARLGVADPYAHSDPVGAVPR